MEQARLDFEAERRLDRTLLRRNLLVATGIFILTLVVYLAGAVSFALPGEPASTLAQLSGLQISITYRQALWRHLIAGIAALAPAASSVLAVNHVCAFFSAATSALAYLVLAQLFILLLDREHYEVSIGGDPLARIGFISGVSAFVGALCFAFCCPFWYASAQTYPQGFHLAWFLLSVFLLLRFAAGRSFIAFAAFCVLYGAGLAQASVFVAWSPVCLLGALYLLWVQNRLGSRTFTAFILFVAVPFLGMLAWSVHAFQVSDGCALLGSQWDSLKILKETVKALAEGVYGSFQRVRWMILLGLTVLPWLASLLVARRTLNGEHGIAIVFLHLAIAVTSILVLLDPAFAPWHLDRAAALQMVPYLMTAASFAYFVAVLLTLPTLLAESAAPRGAAVGRYAIAAVAILFTGFTVWHNADDANLRARGFIRTYVETVLDSLEGRDWLVSNGALDPNLLLRARERGLTLHAIDLSKERAAHPAADYKDDLPGITLRNKADIGPGPLATEWISHRDDAGARLALAFLPDFWHMGPYEPVPHGLVFLGLSPEEASAGATPEAASAFLDATAKLREELESIPEDADEYVRSLGEYLKRQVSFFGNNVGCQLESNGLEEEAFGLFSRMHEFDPDNVSCLLNWVALIQKGLHPEIRDDALADLEELERKRKASAIPNVWALSATYGYVVHPSAFESLGWTWANSGQPNLAIRSLGKAAQGAEGLQKNRIQALLSEVYLRSGDLENSEASSLEILKEFPGDLAALVRLVRIHAMRGDVEGAEKFLEQARAAGLSGDSVLYESAAVHLAANQIDLARIEAGKLADLSPENPEAIAIQFAVQSRLFETAESAAERDRIAPEIRALADRLLKVSGADDCRALMLHGRAGLYDGRFTEAREDLLAALKVARGSEGAAIYEMILQADFALVDKAAAARHSKELLHIAPDHAFANYILGSLALERDEYESAEDFLLHALAVSPKDVRVLNDLAMSEFYLGKFDNAEKHVREALGLDGQLYGAWDTLGCILMAKKDHDAAADALETALKLGEADPRVHLHVALNHFRSGDKDAARRIVEQLDADAAEFTGQDARDYADLRKQLVATN